MQPHHDLPGLMALQENFKEATTELRLADQSQLHNKHLLAQALEATNGKDEAARLYKEVAENNFNTVDFALLRAPALKKAGYEPPRPKTERDAPVEARPLLLANQECPH
jgi:hypothetical protein